MEVDSEQTTILLDWRSMASFLKTLLSPLAILRMQKTMVAMVISEFKSISGIKLFSRNWPHNKSFRENFFTIYFYYASTSAAVGLHHPVFYLSAN